jgi:uncharacterized membrane protein
MSREKNLELERLVFFSDAVIAIAITLLALDLKLDIDRSEHLRFADIGHAWPKFVSFFLSFVYVAVFWIVHHRFFYHIRKIDRKLLRYNLAWLLFITTLPFTTSLISTHPFDIPAMCSYCVNTLMITLCQNQIWDYVAVRPDYLKEGTDKAIINDYRLSCNVAMANALIAVAISFINPIAAFIVLILRIPMIAVARRIFGK